METARLAGIASEQMARAETAETNNAKQAARIKELESERIMIVSHATMGETAGVGMTVNEISVRVTALRNALYNEGKKEAEALKAKLSAVEKALEPSASGTAVLEEACKLVERRINMVPSDTKAFRAYQDACRHILGDLRALHPEADKLSDDRAKGEGWIMSPPKFHRYPYSVENIGGKWFLFNHLGNGASRTVSEHKTAKAARDAAPALPTHSSSELV